MELKLRIDGRKSVETFTELHKHYMRKMRMIAWVLKGTATNCRDIHRAMKMNTEATTVQMHGAISVTLLLQG